MELLNISLFVCCLQILLVGWQPQQEQFLLVSELHFEAFVKKMIWK